MRTVNSQAAALAVLGLCVTGPVMAEDVVVTGWGGGAQEAMSRIFMEPFSKETGITVRQDSWTGGWGTIQAMAASKSYKWDVLQVEVADLVRGCQEGIFAKLDWESLDKSKFLPDAIHECGVGNLGWAHIMAYNVEKFAGTKPATSADFFDLAGFPGTRGMYKSPRYNLELALMADGVLPAEVYRTLSTPEGVDRAFAKLDTIKSSVHWWEGSAQPIDWLASGEVVMSTAWNGRVPDAQRAGKPLKPLWDNALFGFDFWVVFAKGPNPSGGEEFVSFYSADPARQVAYAEQFFYGPTMLEAAALVTPEVAANLPIGANVETAIYLGSQASIDFWLDRNEDLTARFNTWLGAQ